MGITHDQAGSCSVEHRHIGHRNDVLACRDRAGIVSNLRLCVDVEHFEEINFIARVILCTLEGINHQRPELFERERGVIGLEAALHLCRMRDQLPLVAFRILVTRRRHLNLMYGGRVEITDSP